ncbi:alpha/beta fold hydrolase [Bacillus kwashiorkori]|uniref:alpha/beta fold hydrolase n=1 Tax=Bacillus kwashiorkori TaxID=1522318 RepID=UPI000785F536|nr:alpha/beta hydrolase [Bacillus kwashiorkori]
MSKYQINDTLKKKNEPLNVNGMDLFYEIYPHATATKTIVLLHGFLASSFSFRFLIPLLKDDYEIVTIDLPPFGKSGKGRKFLYSYENLARTVKDALHFLQINSPILVGHSMGGQICLYMAKNWPQQFPTLILLSCSAYLKKAKQSLRMSCYLPFSYLLVKQLLKRSGLQKNLESVVYDQQLINDEMVKGYLQPFIESNEIFQGLTKFIRDREGDLSSDVLQKIQSHCLLIWGEFDKIIPLSSGKRMAQELPNAKLIVLKNTGHLVPEEKPEATAKHIKQFIKNAD